MIYQEQIGDNLLVSTYTPEGTIHVDRLSIPRSEQFIWVECSQDDPLRVKGYASQNGSPVKKVQQRYLNKYRKLEFLNSLPKDKSERIFNQNMPEFYSLDIETEMIDGEELNEDDPKGKVLSVAFADTHGHCVVMTIKPIDEDKLERFKENLNKRVGEYFKNLEAPLLKEWTIKLKQYSSEAQMLADLFYNWMTKMPFITGWNFLKFDMRYLVNRCKKLNINYKKLSPTENFYTYTISDKFNRALKHKVELPAHRGVVDYLTYFEKWDSSMKIKSSLNLDEVAGEILKVSKYHYNGTLMDLYREDHETFLLYNCIDTILVSLIHMKINTLATAIGLCQQGKVSLHETLHASIICENLFSDYYLHPDNNRDKVVFVNKQEKEDDGSKYSGGYVEEPEVGIKNDVMILDYESEFPSIMMAFNVGTDTLLGHTNDNGETYVDFKGDIHKIDPELHVWSSQRTVFTKEFDSSTRTIVAKLFDKRVAAKNAVEEIDEEIKYYKDLLKAA